MKKGFFPGFVTFSFTIPELSAHLPNYLYKTEPKYNLNFIYNLHFGDPKLINLVGTDLTFSLPGGVCMWGIQPGPNFS